jgi:hypothetical protein
MVHVTRRRVPASLVPAKSGKPHAVELDLRADERGVVLQVLRRNRGDAKGDVTVVLAPSHARELQRLLQGRADEADRQAYQATREESLEDAVAAVAAALRSDV